jgi:hypothetical protein
VKISCSQTMIITCETFATHCDCFFQPMDMEAIERMETHYTGHLLQKHADEGIDNKMFGCSCLC